jgi:hypothetical protein
MVKILKFTEIGVNNGREYEYPLYINVEALDSVETYDHYMTIHTKAGKSYKVNKNETIQILEQFISEENEVA